MRNEYFVDTSFLVALGHPRDENHEQALALSRQLVIEKAQMVTSQAVVLEVGNTMAKQRYRPQFLQVLEALDSDPLVEVVPLTDSFYQNAIALFRVRMDKDWSLTDCICFVVMTQRGITKALTTDFHFVQAGFEALLIR